MVGTQQKSSSEMRCYSLIVDEFRYHGYIINDMLLNKDDEDDEDIENQFMRKNAVGNMLVRKFSLSLAESYCCSI